MFGIPVRTLRRPRTRVTMQFHQPRVSWRIVLGLQRRPVPVTRAVTGEGRVVDLLTRALARAAGPPPDPVAAMADLLDPDDRGLGATFAAASVDGQVGGETGSVGRTLPRVTDPLLLVVSALGLSAWRWTGGSRDPLVVSYRIASEAIVGVADTGVASPVGAPVVRVGFVDGSFFDYCVQPPHQAFLAACAERWPARPTTGVDRADR